MTKETEPKTNPEQGKPTSRSAFEFVKGLFRKAKESKQIEKIEILCDRLPDGPIIDNRSGCKINNDRFTTQIETEQIGTFNPCSSRVKIQRDAEGALVQIDRTIFPFDDKGTTSPINEFFDPSNPVGSTLPLQGVVESLEQAHKSVRKAVLG